jgi:hypothetical protein
MDQMRETDDRQELRELMLDLLRMQEQILQRMERIEEAVKKRDEP